MRGNFMNCQNIKCVKSLDKQSLFNIHFINEMKSLRSWRPLSIYIYI